MKNTAAGVSVTRIHLSVGLLELFRFDRHPHAFPRHSHERYTFGVFGRENGRIRQGGAEWRAADGTILAIAPDEIHSAEPSRSGWSYRSFYPSADIMAAALGSEGAVLPRFDRPVIVDPALGRALARLHARLESAPPTPDLEERLLLLLRRLAMGHGTPRPAAPSAPSTAAVTRARAYIDAHTDLPVSLADLSAASGVSPFHLIRSFHQMVGMPPHAYLTQRRANRARELLLAGEPLSAAAQHCRFSDQSHLTRTFKRIFGVTPGVYARGAASPL